MAAGLVSEAEKQCLDSLWDQVKNDCLNAGGTLFLGTEQHETFVQLLKANSGNKGVNYEHWRNGGGSRFKHQLWIRENGDVFVFEHVCDEEDLAI